MNTRIMLLVAALGMLLVLQSPAVAQYALEFDGEKGYVEIPDHDALDMAETVTVEAWICPNRFPIGHSVVVDKGEDRVHDSHNYYLKINDSNQVYFGYENEPQDHVYAVSSFAFTPSDTGWFHLAGQRRADGMLEVYVNGHLEGAEPTSISLPVTTSPVYLGAGFSTDENPDEMIHHLGCKMDEVRISNIARYDGPFEPATRLTADEHTVALWHFDEGEGYEVWDESGTHCGTFCDAEAPWSFECGELAEGVWWILGGPGCTLALYPENLRTYYPCNGSYSMQLYVEGVADLGAFEVCTGFHAGISVFSALEVDTFLGSTGRFVYPLDPIPCAPSCLDDGVRYGAYSTGPEVGPSGSGPLAQIFFTRMVDGAWEDFVCLDSWELVDTQLPPGLIQVAEASGAEILHQPFCYGDFNDDSDVTVIDIMQVAGRWGCCEGEDCYEDTYDVNLTEPGNYCASVPDGCIDVVDVQEVAGRWGQGCPEGGLRAPLLGDHSPTIKIWPESLTVCCDVGDTASFAVIVEDGYDLGAFEVELSLDPTVIRVEDVVIGDFLGATGRSVYALGPETDDQTGRITFGAWTTGEIPGPEGEGTLATIIVSIQSCGKASDVRITDATLTYTHGWPLELAGTSDGWVGTSCSAGAPPLEHQSLDDFTLYPSQPNPLSVSTTIGFAVPATSNGRLPLEIVIYNVSGQVVGRLAEGVYQPGYHSAVWNGQDENGARVGSGVYFCQLRASGKSQTRRIILMK